MKKFLSAFTAAIFTFSIISATASESLAFFIHNNDYYENYDKEYVAIVQLEDAPLSDYEYSLTNGVNEFIFTEEGQAVYENLKSEHLDVLQKIDEYTEDVTEIIYDYTSAYNGFSIVIKESEYESIHDNIESLGIKNIYLTEEYTQNKEINLNKNTYSSTPSAIDLTDRILEETGVSKV